MIRLILIFLINLILFVWSDVTDTTAGDFLYISQAKLELGSSATAFEYAGGTIQGELAACQRYYFRNTANGGESIIRYAFCGASLNGQGQVQFPVPMRVVPTSLDSATIKFFDYSGNSRDMSSVGFNQASNTGCQVFGTISGGTAGHVGTILGQTSGSYIGLNAEL